MKTGTATPATGAQSASTTTESAIGALGALGANYNQNLDSVDYRELGISAAQWVRGFYPVPADDDVEPGDHFAITTIRDAAAQGFRTIFSLKFPYANSSFPEPGSAELATELARLGQILPHVLGQVDILTIGNEPFIESRPQERDERLNAFYETIARHVIDRRAQGGPDTAGTALYMGALNRLDLEAERTGAVERWMTFVRQTPEIDGVDIHPHLPGPDAVEDFLGYILPRMRSDQTFLVTEFSLVWHWQDHLEDLIPATFADHYGLDPSLRVWQVIRTAIEKPFPARQWRDFLESCPWFMEHSGFLRDQMALYRGTGRLAVATYGFRQDDLMVRDFRSDTVPWLLNSVFAPYTVAQPDDGPAAPGYWLESFRDVQRQ